MAHSTTHDATGAVPLDPAHLRADVRANYGHVARHPDAGFHAHTARHLALRCCYNVAAMDAPVQWSPWAVSPTRSSSGRSRRPPGSSTSASTVSR